MTSWGGPRASRSLLAAVAAAALAGPASSAPCALPRTTGCSTCTADPNCFYALSYGSAGACVNLTSITAADYVISLSSPCARVPTCAAHSTCTTCASDANCMTCGQTSSTALCVPYASSSSNAAACNAPVSVQTSGGCSSGGGGSTATASVQLDGVNGEVQRETWTAIGGAVGVAAALVSWLLRAIYSAEAKAHPLMDSYVAAAAATWRLTAVAFGLQIFSTALAIAGLIVPWWAGGVSVSVASASGSASASAYAYVSAITISFKVCASPRVDISACDSLAVLNPITAIGAAVVLGALLFFVLPAALLSCCAARTLAGVERHRALPKVEGCCLPSYPAILGLGWFGFIIALVGASEIWAVLLVLWAFLGLGLVRNAVGAGGAMLATALACLLVANIISSVVGCCRLGSMPGVGRSRTNCCCVERSLAANGAVVSAGGLASSAPSVRSVNTDEATAYLQRGGFHPAFAPQPPFAP